MSTRVLETVLTGRNLLSPVLATASRDVAAYSSSVSTAQGKAAASAQTAASTQARAATTAATSTTAGATTQSVAAQKIAASNVKASTSAQASASAQMRAHTQAAESATVAARVQEAANRSLATSNGMLSGSLTPLTASLGAVALGIGYAGYRGMEFDAAMSQVQAASQASAGDLERLRAAAIDAGAETKYSGEEAAQGITELSKAGVSTADILNGGLTGALNLAAAGQMEVADAAEIGATALSVFGLEGSQMSHVADLLAAGAGKAQGSVYDLGAALNQSALVADQTGLSIEDTAGALAMFASNGLTGSDAGTSFKTMLQALNPNSEAAAKAMEAIGFSAYDAQGNFVGLEGVASQLKDGLSKLTVEQQNATLKTIFGSDAVRAAAILYKEGSAGVREWRDNVNDAGFAQDQAAQLTDNLKGDLEKLGGAFDSVMTQMGSGAQGPLREVVQMFTGLLEGAGWAIDAFTSLDTPVQVAIASIGAFVLMKNPVVDFAETAYLKLQYAKDAVTNFATSADTARTAVGNLASAAVPIVAVAAIGWAATQTYDFATAAGNAREEVAEMWEAVDDSRGSAQLEALARHVEEVQEKVRKLREELPKTEGAFQGFLAPLGMLENGGTIEALDEYQDALARAEQAQKDAAHTANTLGNWFGLNRDQVLDLAEKYDVDLTQGTQNAYMQFQAFYTTEYGKGPLNSTRELIGSMETMADVTATAEERIDALKTALDILGGATVSVFEAQSSLQQVVDSAAGALEGLSGNVLDGNGKLNAYSESGRAAGDVLVNIRDRGNDLITTMVEQGASLDEVRVADAQLRQSFIDSAMQMGISQGAANALADEILGVPQERETRFTAATDQAAAKIAALQLQIDAVARDRTASINFRATMPDLNGAVSGSGRMGTYAEGGYTGPGDKYQVAGVVHAGEYVLTKEQTNRLGIDRIEAFANRGYADGGLVTLNGLADTTGATAGLARTADLLATSVEATVKRLSEGVAGTGAAGGSWQALWAQVHAQFPTARMTSNYRPGDPGKHGQGKAIDVAGAARMDTSMMYKINKWAAATMGANLAELIYTPGINLYQGKPHTYNAATRADHNDHVHLAAREKGGPVWPGQNFLVGENGPEIARFNAPATVYPNGTSPAAMPGYGAAGNGGAMPNGPVQVLVDARVYMGDRDITDIVRIEASAVYADAKRSERINGRSV